MAELVYLLPVWETIGNAWKKVRGTKGSVWVALILLFLITLALGTATYLIGEIIPALEKPLQFVVQVFTYLLQTSMLYIGIQRAFDLPISYTQIFRGITYPIWLKLIGVYILQLLVFVPIIALFFISVAFWGFGSENAISFFILSGILFLIACFAAFYIGIRIGLASAFVLDRSTAPWESIKLSWRATRHNFWRIVAIIIIELIILAISAIPLGIGLIWTIPFAYILFGLVYKNLSLNATTDIII